ncbi:TonB-dependent receptor [Phascolarctobacterium succinatutens]|uniref:TonB-dependent receptor plug domain-containing protein n=1 Tax=Phascolarctobacterium succinatutens TaxID=626940 RepID=UPI002E7655F7|nr:TonB-dependent receptor [Phascolarctobacterium succinatutens]MEE0508499.1 TonB-dependent receptor [Phascolarctobacterium succinatutens]
MSLMSKKMVNGAVALGCMLFAAPVMAHEALNEYVLDPMMVTAARYEKRDVDIPAATEIYDQQKIEKLGANNVMEVVKNIPGFTLTASPTGNTYIGFRGIAKDNVAILVNGIPLNQDGNYDLESISADIIDRIEVVKGGATVLYGSNASAGVINIITNKKAAKNKVLIGFGDKNKFKGAVNVATDKLQLSYSRQQSKDRGFVYKNSGASNYYTGDKLEKDSLNLQYAISDKLSLQYMYSKKVSDCSKSVNGVYKPGFHSDIKYNFGQLRYVNDDLQATVFFRNRDWKFNTSTHQKGHNYGADLQDKFKLGNTMLTVGANYENENTKNSNNIEAAKRDSAAVFFMTETEVSDKTKIFLGAREAYVEKSGSKFCPQFQVMHSLGTDDNIYLNVNRSMRAPHVNEQWGTSTQLMNPDLKAENGWNYEFGWKKKLAADELFKVNLYHMDINDRIYSQRNYNGSGKSMFLNANKYRNTGVEVSYEKAASEKFSYNVGVSYGNPEQKLAKGDWQRVDFKLGLHAGVGYNLGKTNANIYANYMAERINGVKPMLDLTLNVKQQITKNDALRFAVYNLLDRDDIRTGSSSGTGAMLEERNWMLSYEHSF